MKQPLPPVISEDIDAAERQLHAKIDTAAADCETVKDLAKVEKLRQDMSRFQVSALKSQVSTLRREVSDINSRLKFFEDRAAAEAARLAALEAKMQEEEAQRRRQEEEAKAREEERKRKEEEERAKFDGIFNDSKQLDETKKQRMRGFLEKYRAQFKECKLLYRGTEDGF